MFIFSHAKTITFNNFILSEVRLDAEIFFKTQKI